MRHRRRCCYAALAQRPQRRAAAPTGLSLAGVLCWRAIVFRAASRVRAAASATNSGLHTDVAIELVVDSIPASCSAISLALANVTGALRGPTGVWYAALLPELVASWSCSDPEPGSLFVGTRLFQCADDTMAWNATGASDTHVWALIASPPANGMVHHVSLRCTNSGPLDTRGFRSVFCR